MAPAGGPAANGYICIAMYFWSSALRVTRAQLFPKSPNRNVTTSCNAVGKKKKAETSSIPFFLPLNKEDTNEKDGEIENTREENVRRNTWGFSPYVPGRTNAWLFRRRIKDLLIRGMMTMSKTAKDPRRNVKLV